MQIKNKLFFILLSILILFKSSFYLSAEEFDIAAEKIVIDKEKNILIGTGSVVAKDKAGRTIKSDKMIYKKSSEVLIAEGFVEIFDLEENILTADKASYDKLNEIIVTYQNSKLTIKEGYTISSNKLNYNIRKKTITSNQNSILEDVDGNMAIVDMFEHNIQKNIFSSVGKIQVLDMNKNKYFFKELYVDTKKMEMIGSDASAVFDQDNFGVSKENDPRFKANQIYITKNKTDLLKGVFTVCHQEKDKCPPWSIKAKKISHDKVKKTIYYEHAILKVYDIPVFYFPKFLHPDPTVKRRSGFLFPLFTNTSNLGAGFGIPYYWALNNDKDLTFTTKIYSNENALFMNEYRQAFKNGFLTLDTSYTEGYKNITSNKTSGSRNHIFGQVDVTLNQDESYESNMSLKVQRTSNDTFFRSHDVDTALVDSENTNLENAFNYNYNENNMFFNFSASVYENLREKTNNRYEYVLPNIMYGKTFFTKKYGFFDFTSNAVYKNYDSDKHLSVLNNEVIWTSNSLTTKKGVVNTLGGMISNINYEAKNTPDYKTKGTVNELKSVLTYKSSLPMKKDNINSFNIFSPNFMLRYAPGHMRDLGDESLMLKQTNLFAMNKTSEIENGLSAILGFDFKKNDINEDGSIREKYTLSIGQVFRDENNYDIPSKSSLDQKSSDVVGELNYNFLKVGNLKYKFSLDHNIEEMNYSEISSNFNFGKIDFDLDYLEERNHVGEENYINTGINLNLNKNNKLSLGTKKNFKTESTEFYDMSYQYLNDCLTAGLVYRREFYEDAEVEQKDTLMFQITFVPFGGVKTPTFINP